MKTGEWGGLLGLLAFFGLLLLLGSGPRCEVHVDSRPTSSGVPVRECWRPTGRWEVWADIWTSEEGDWQRVAEAPDLDSCIRFGNGLGVRRWGCALESERVECEP